jgi:hypothetical protein
MFILRYEEVVLQSSSLALYHETNKVLKRTRRKAFHNENKDTSFPWSEQT